ncbi:D-arabinono-1,4-lactone oxidase [Nesterenkonia rhizosphaerae]|uniref:FAD-binding protein n=1 Tax=Nesterenkonia rhizosphaerae TaxID=1348272 RepID=A0ABP9FS12_9MICC
MSRRSSVGSGASIPEAASPPARPSGTGAEPGSNWANNLQYQAAQLMRPRNLDELHSAVVSSGRIKPLGSRHSFNTIADTSGALVDLSEMPRIFDIDEAIPAVTVDAAMRYGELALLLQQRGWALQNMASLPHISVVGSVATGTHGSGDRNPPLAAAVREVQLMTGTGTLRTLRRGEPDFGAAVVSLGALGVVTQISLDIVPSFQVRQDVYQGLGWEQVLFNFDQLTSSAYSVSLFTRWGADTFGHAWLKSTENPPEELLGVHALTDDIGLVEGTAERTTPQSGVWGSWDQRLPHFKLEFTPSNGSELQTEYLLPRDNAVPAMQELRRMGEQLDPHLLITEIRTMAADEQWLSGAFQRDTVGFHFTWRQHTLDVLSLLPLLEERLLPLGARPHWGKLFAVPDLTGMYPRLGDFTTVAEQMDPEGKFHNDFLTTVLF